MGDRAEALIEAWGVGPAVREWLKEPCGGCRERRDRLNALHAWARRLEREPAAKARAWLAAIMGA